MERESFTFFTLLFFFLKVRDFFCCLPEWLWLYYGGNQVSFVFLNPEFKIIYIL